jgi:hypothetical protein
LLENDIEFRNSLIADNIRKRRASDMEVYQSDDRPNNANTIPIEHIYTDA